MREKNCDSQMWCDHPNTHRTCQALSTFPKRWPRRTACLGGRTGCMAGSLGRFLNPIRRRRALPGSSRVRFQLKSGPTHRGIELHRANLGDFRGQYSWENAYCVEACAWKVACASFVMSGREAPLRGFVDCLLFLSLELLGLIDWHSNSIDNVWVLSIHVPFDS